jgi:hypothetical protein
MLEEVYNQFPLRVEDYATLFTRSELMKDFMKNYIKFSGIGP